MRLFPPRQVPQGPEQWGESGIRAMKVSLAGLGATAALQVVIVALTGSVAVLSDTIHNLSDALTAVPLWIAFALGRREADRRFTYGYHRAEDLAGLVIVAAIALSGVGVVWESMRRLLDPRALEGAGWVVVAGVIGAAGNEWVARYRMRVGRAIGSEALVADGHHARTDALTSLAVVASGLGSLLGVPWADPVAGLAIGAVILLLLRQTARRVFGRLMDVVDPDLLERLGHLIGGVPGVEAVTLLRARWAGHRLLTEVAVEVDPSLTVADGHDICEEVRHRVFHDLPYRVEVLVHLDPRPGDQDPHARTAHHGRAGRPAGGRG